MPCCPIHALQGGRQIRRCCSSPPPAACAGRFGATCRCPPTALSQPRPMTPRAHSSLITAGTTAPTRSSGWATAGTSGAPAESALPATWVPPFQPSGASSFLLLPETILQQCVSAFTAPPTHTLPPLAARAAAGVAAAAAARGRPRIRADLDTELDLAAVQGRGVGCGAAASTVCSGCCRQLRGRWCL